MYQKLVISFVAGVIIGGSYVQAVWGQDPLTQSVLKAWMGGASKDLISVDQTVSSSGSDALNVVDQPAGDSTLIAKLTLALPAWVAIHEDMEGEPGRVLGARRFDPGMYSGESVELLRATLPQGLYYAMLYADDGDRQFDLKKDVQVKDISGKPVMTSFNAR